MKVPRRTALRRVASLVAVMVVATLAVMGVTSTVAMAAGAMASATSYEATTEDGAKVSVGAPQGALPDGATLHVDPVTSNEDVQAVTDELDAAAVSYDGFAAFDVYFTDADGNEIEPTEAVSVRFELPEGSVPEGAEGLAIHHLAEAEDGTVADVEAVADDGDATEGTISVQDDATVDAEFTVGDLSVLAFSWAENAGENVAETTAAAEVTSTSSSATRATTGTNLLTETFTGSSVADPDSWLRFGTAGLTAASKGSEWYVGNYTDGTGSYLNGDHGDGYLQLTDASGGDTGTVLYNQPVQSRLGLDISFYQWQFNGSTNPPADGIGFFLTDGSYDLSKQGPQGSGCGGALGYSAIENNGDEDNVEPGIEHGVLGIGLDVF
ncbi:lectin-like domain-containing protein, partial [Thermophilibacter provencensis]